MFLNYGSNRSMCKTLWMLWRKILAFESELATKYSRNITLVNSTMCADVCLSSFTVHFFGYNFGIEAPPMGVSIGL